MHALFSDRRRARIRAAFDMLGAAGSRVFLNRYIWLLFFLTACAITLTKQEVAGAVCFAILICLALICCDNLLATTLPFLLLCVFVTKCYDSFSVFIGYLWLALPALLSLLFHFTVYRRPLRIGSTFRPMLAVAVALMLGGLGVLSFAEYFTPTGLYYVFFLGIGMIGAYLLLKPRLCGRKNRERLLSALYVMGMFAAFLVFAYWLENWEYWRLNHTLPELQAANNLSTLMLFALPCPFYFVPRSRSHLLSAGAMLLALLISGSRGGLLCGGILFVLCLLGSAVWDAEHRFFYICFAIAVSGAAFYLGDRLLGLSHGVLSGNFFTKEEARYQLMLRAKELFLKYPVFGHGLAYRGNVDLYDPKTGAMTWYHMIVPQIVASLGSIGILAYGWQLLARVRAVITAMKRECGRDRGAVMTVGLSYGGVLLMSLVNPGLFCPIPYALLAVMLMCTIDEREASEREVGCMQGRK